MKTRLVRRAQLLLEPFQTKAAQQGEGVRPERGGDWVGGGGEGGEGEGGGGGGGEAVGGEAVGGGAVGGVGEGGGEGG